ncbi:MAG: CAP domain-containing protein [Armatimonadetes bacterium]|nr:CAP domain-containing protein [Armatimonadota bacterium]
MTKLSLYLATLLLGSNFSATTVPPPKPQMVVTARMASAEQKLVDMVNTERWDRNLGVLSVNPLLAQVAREHSREMYEKSYFDHISPTPELRSPMSRYLRDLGHTPTWAYLGENLFYCSIVDTARGHDCLMKSIKHRENILNPRFEQIGVGVYVSPDGQFFVTELFLSQID